MAFRLVSSGGDVTDAAVVNMYASGTVWPGCVVQFRAVDNKVSAASSSSTSTMIFGIALDYAQGASDKMVRVIPFVPGQLWEADCTNNTHTGQILFKHALTDSTALANTSYDMTLNTGVFLVYNVRGAAADKKVIGEFLRIPQSWHNSSTALAS